VWSLEELFAVAERALSRKNHGGVLGSAHLHGDAEMRNPGGCVAVICEVATVVAVSATTPEAISDHRDAEGG
jgi:hypothetical protein